ncbi:hypothetical protein EIP91_006328, partial [Steccherinum ochraceum]
MAAARPYARLLSTSPPSPLALTRVLRSPPRMFSSGTTGNTTSRVHPSPSQVTQASSLHMTVSTTISDYLLITHVFAHAL